MGPVVAACAELALACRASAALRERMRVADQAHMLHALGAFHEMPPVHNQSCQVVAQHYAQTGTVPWAALAVASPVAAHHGVEPAVAPWVEHLAGDP